MEKGIVKLTNINDVSLLNEDIKYINIDIDTYDETLNNYLNQSGQNYMFSDYINGVYGYTYVDYETFSRSEYILNSIINDMPKNLNDIEKAKYLYVSLGNILEYDINSNPDKNDNYNYSLLININNIWGSIANHKCNSLITSKIYYYICRKLNIITSIEKSTEDNSYYNKLTINNEILTVDLYKDIPYIQSKFKTKYFDNYNDDINLDYKISYIKDNYSDKLIEESLKNISNNTLESILSKTSTIMDISNISSSSLDIIYELIIKKYYPYKDITINNLYLNDIYNNQEHFLLFSDKDKHFSYNYKTNSFIEISNDDIKKNIDNGKMGIYLGEEIPQFNRSE